MNKIIVVGEEFKEELEKGLSFDKNKLLILEDQEIVFDFDQSSLTLDIEVKPNQTLKVISKNQNTKNRITYHLQENSRLEVFQFGMNCQDQITVDLDQVYASVDYRYSTINDQDTVFQINVNHNGKKTTSNVVNHGVNKNEKSLTFEVNGTVLKTSDHCVCNQDNQIIELQNGFSSIKPNLWIDNYEVEANHAAYIGHFKKSELFYLMSRGIEEKKCYELLLKGFLLQQQSLQPELVEWFFTSLNI